MDFAAVIKSPMQDKDWFSKCTIVGLMTLIPVVGTLNMLGWAKAVYANAKAGDTTLPPASLNYIGAGWEMFLAILPVALVVFGGSIVGAIIALLKVGILTSLYYLAFSLANLAIMCVLVPALIYRHFVHGTGFMGALDLAGVMRVITTNTSMFATFAGLYLVGNIISGAGMAACCLGIIVSAPFGAAVHGYAIRAFEQANGGL
jgi:hypothetical protein